MGFSKEWEEVYKNDKQLSVWPWTDLISLVKRYVKLNKGDRILELGCGAGANIPFLSSIEGTSYFAVEGSQYIVDLLQSKYLNNPRISIKCGDFTECIPFEGKFNLVVDRSAVTHNMVPDIKNTLRLVNEILADGGAFIGLDWHSVCYTFFQEDVEEYEVIDDRTRIYKTGDFAGSGITYFSDEESLKEMLSDFDIKILYEKRYEYKEPKIELRGAWDFVAFKRYEL